MMVPINKPPLRFVYFILQQPCASGFRDTVGRIKTFKHAPVQRSEATARSSLAFHGKSPVVRASVSWSHSPSQQLDLHMPFYYRSSTLLFVTQSAVETRLEILFLLYQHCTVK